MVGKGKRSQAVIDAIVRNGSVYFAAVGGAGALLSKCITSAEVVAYDDLGTEAIRKLTVENFPAIVVSTVREIICMKLRSKNTEKWRNKIHEENPFDGIQKSLVCSMGMV